MIITASSEQIPVKMKLKMPITTAAFFRLGSLGCSISRFTCASDSSPLMASTECPKAIMIPSRPNFVGRSLPFNQPSAALLKCRFSCGSHGESEQHGDEIIGNVSEAGCDRVLVCRVNEFVDQP